MANVGRVGGNPKLKEVNRKGRGRPVGAKNKLPKTLKAMIEQALMESGGVKYLKYQAEHNSTAFLSLLGKILPRHIEVESPSLQDALEEIKQYATVLQMPEIIRQVEGIRELH